MTPMSINLHTVVSNLLLEAYCEPTTPQRSILCKAAQRLLPSLPSKQRSEADRLLRNITWDLPRGHANSGFVAHAVVRFAMHPAT